MALDFRRQRARAGFLACACVLAACGASSTDTASDAGGVPSQPALPHSSDPSGDSDAGTGPASTSGDAAVDETITVTTMSIPTLRNPNAPGHPSVGAIVLLTGVVTAVKNNGTAHFFALQDPKATTWGGVTVYLGPTGVPPAPGTVVSVVGVYSTLYGQDELDTTKEGRVDITGTASIPAPIDVAVGDMNTTGIHAHDLQSMLVRVRNVTVTDATAGQDFSVDVNGAPLLSWETISSYVANDVGPSPFPVASGDHFTSITGVGVFLPGTSGSGIGKIAPRRAADLVR